MTDEAAVHACAAQVRQAVGDEPLFGRTRYVVAPDRLLNVLVNSLPKRMVDRLIARRLGLMPAP